ncbi:hyaluronoglucosaminidase [Kitasatospora sp. MAP12-15]|uniref:beta-N-acetylglucosaminidase domain-containing protein n=1 Tax=unclassified Kitasatospora TaxID=2633591 RepID=UPI0024754073|nr:beta-N-acetylglucosaminidase domain-containing protein [Kitasatospora sp. MAP12-44]MDH6113268.1 hyaluronoglucosaminidase [Kitasatospora sp. MAP12-44]
MQTRVSAAAGRRLRQQLEDSPALREVLHHPAVLVTRRATARTARLVAPRTADLLIADLKGTEPLLPEVRVLMGRTTSGTGVLTQRRTTLRIAATLSVAAVIGTLLATAPASAAPGQGSAISVSAPAPVRTPLGNLANPQVFPQPQEQHLAGKPVAVPASVVLALAPQADPGALDAVREVLGDAGATGFTTPAPTPAPGSLVVYVGGPGEESDGGAQQALHALGAPSPAGLAPGGYVLAAGQLPVPGAAGTYGVVVLAGVDAEGTFHAAQSLRQLLTGIPAGQGQSAGAFGFPGIVLRDWPTGAPVRGIAESFFGTPWTTAQRLDQIDFLGRTKQNFYLYAPGDDPYRQAQWRDPYPADQQADLRALADRARLNHVTLGYAVAPNQSFCYSSGKDVDALIAKLAAMRELGFEAFQLQFQDVAYNYNEWHCSQDSRTYGTGAAAAAKAQSELAAKVQSRLIAANPDLAPLSIVPTEYYQAGPSIYRTALAAGLPSAVQIAWTGVGVIPGTITTGQTTDTAALLQHPLVTMDNYPVNDSTPDRLYLGPYVGRDPGVATDSAMLLTSGMQQPTASRIAFSTAADFGWNPTGYQSDASWQYALRAVAAGAVPGSPTDAGSGPALAALTALAGNSASSPLAGQESGYLTPLLAAFWAALQPAGGGTVDLGKLQQAADPLRAAFSTMAGAPAALGAGPDAADGSLAAETAPWLSRLGTYGQAGQAAVDMLLAQHHGDGAGAWQARVTLRQLRTQLAQGAVTVGAGVLDPFLDQALQASDSWSGVSAGSLSPTTTMGAANDHGPELMTDSSPDTFYWTSDPPQHGDAFGIDLGDGRPVDTVTVRMGSTDGQADPGSDAAAAADDYLHDGVLEYTTGDGGWKQLVKVHNQKTVAAKLPDGVLVKAIRLRATATQQTAVAVRDFSVSAPGADQVTVSGGPAPAAGSSISSVLDGDPDTAYRAAAPPTAADTPLTVDLGQTRPLDRITVLTDPTVKATATVDVRKADGSWARVGTLQPGYNEIPTGGQPADALRLTWAPGGDAPVVNQIVPWYADLPIARLTLADPELDVIAGAATPAGTQAAVDAVRPEGASGEVHAEPPAGVPGLTVTPAPAPGTPGAPVSVPRGGRADTAVQVSAAAGTPSGTYAVPVDFTSNGVTIRQTLQVHVVPPTAGPDLALTATASSSGDLSAKYPASAVTDGNAATRWASPPVDNAWVQLQLAQPTRLGSVVLHWQGAYASSYLVQTSPDGVTWTTVATVATVANGHGGTETVRFDAPGTQFVRMQGVNRATRYGYSLFGIEAYAVAGAPTAPSTPVTPPTAPTGPGAPTTAPTTTPSGVPSAPAGSPPPTAPPTPVPSPTSAVPAGGVPMPPMPSPSMPAMPVQH